jgi:multidrug resistance efflux pump
MEIFLTIAYFFLVRLIFFDFKLMRFNLFWKFIVFGLYAAAWTTEIVLLGQFTPYTKDLMVQSYVVPIAPLWGGEVTEVFVENNQHVKKGDPLYQMDRTVFQSRVDGLEAALAGAGTDVGELTQQLEAARARVAKTRAEVEITRSEYDMIKAAADRNAVPRLRLQQITERLRSLEAELTVNQALERQARLALESEIGDEHVVVAEALAELARARYDLEHTTVYAPSDGYVANLQLHPGMIVRLKTPVMSFVSADEYWMIAKIIQNSSQRVKAGDTAEVSFLMYPGKVFSAKVENIVWGSGNAQFYPSGQLPREEQVVPAQSFFVRLRLDEDNDDLQLRFGATGTAAIFSASTPDFLLVLRKLEIRMESYMNYLFNPF